MPLGRMPDSTRRFWMGPLMPATPSSDVDQPTDQPEGRIEQPAEHAACADSPSTTNRPTGSMFSKLARPARAGSSPGQHPAAVERRDRQQIEHRQHHVDDRCRPAP